MAKRVTTQRREAKTEQLFEALDQGAPGPREDTVNAAPTEKAEPELTPTEKRLIGEVEALSRRLEEVQLSNMALTQATPVKTAELTPPGEIDLSNLPDPILDRDGYGKALSARVVEHQQKIANYQEQQRQQKVTQENSYNSKVQGVWEDFAIAYPDIAENQDQVEYAARKAMERAMRKGIDPQRYMFGNSPIFIRDVAREYESIFGKVGEGDETVVEELGGPDDDGRTAGIFGGTQSGFSPSKGRTKEQPGDMIKELQARQRKSGFF